MSILVIDSGNTRMKLALYNRMGRKLSGRVAEDRHIEQVAEMMEQSGELTGAVFGSVGSLDARFAESLRMLVDGELLIVTNHTPVPIELDYATPDTLGVDRLAAAVGAAISRPADKTLIIDAGSAVTFDYVTAGRFIGGNISPGLDMRFRALHDHTSRLPRLTLNAADRLPSAIGTDTVTAITAGVFGSWVADIAFAMERAIHARYDTVIFTGGDAPLAMKALEENWGGTSRELLSRIYVTHNPDLVTMGLFHIYRHNENLA